MNVPSPLIIPEILKSNINQILQDNFPLRDKNTFFQLLSPLLNYVAVDQIFEVVFGIKWKDENQFEVNAERLSKIIPIDQSSISTFLGVKKPNINNTTIVCQFPTIKRPMIYNSKYIDQTDQICLQHFEDEEQLFKENVSGFWDFYYVTEMKVKRFCCITKHVFFSEQPQHKNLFDILFPPSILKLDLLMNFHDLGVLFAMFGHGESLAEKASTLFKQCEKYHIPFCNCYSILPIQNPKCYFSPQFPNCFIFISRNSAYFYVYNNPMTPYTEPYLEDISGNKYRDWEDFFQRIILPHL